MSHASQARVSMSPLCQTMAFELPAPSCSHAEFWRVIALQGTLISTISAALPAGATVTGYEARLFLHIDPVVIWIIAASGFAHNFIAPQLREAKMRAILDYKS